VALTSLFDRRFLMPLAFFGLLGLLILVGKNKTCSQENLYLAPRAPHMARAS
jgi:hypothetical protein